MPDSSDPGTFALNLANIGLGVLVLVGCLIFLRGLLEDLLDKALRHESETRSSTHTASMKAPSPMALSDRSLLHDAADFGERASWMHVQNVPKPSEETRSRSAAW